MNSIGFIRSKMITVMVTLFFTGMIISGGTLYLLAGSFPTSLTYQACIAVAVTFLTGVTSVSLAIWSKEYVVIYRERPKETIAKDQQKEKIPAGLLSTAAIGSLHRVDQLPQTWVNELGTRLEAGQIAIYRVNERSLELKYGYALSIEKHAQVGYEFGEGLIGRVAEEAAPLYINPLPPGYITVFSGLGSASPKFLAILPVKCENETIAVIEIATFAALDNATIQQIESACLSLGRILHKTDASKYVPEH